MTTLPDVPYGCLAEFSEKRVEKEQFLCIGFHDSFWSRESEASTSEQLVALSSLLFGILTPNLCVTEVKVSKKMQTFGGDLKKSIMKMKIYVYFLPRDSWELGTSPTG